MGLPLLDQTSPTLEQSYNRRAGRDVWSPGGSRASKQCVIVSLDFKACSYQGELDQTLGQDSGSEIDPCIPGGFVTDSGSEGFAVSPFFLPARFADAEWKKIHVPDPPNPAHL